MSTTQPQDVLLSQDQADAILEEAVERGMYEVGQQGLMGLEPKKRLDDASTLVFQAKRAFANGNKTDNVMAVLFKAEVDMSGPKEQLPQPEPDTPKSNGQPQLNYADLAPDALQAMITALEAAEQTPAVQEEIARINAELQGRPRAEQPQETPPPPQAPAPSPAPGAEPPAPEGHAGPSSSDPFAPPPQPDGGPATTESSGATGGGAIPPPPDAGATSEVQAPESGAEGQLPPPQEAAEAGGRAALEDQLTAPMLRAHGFNFSDVAGLSDEQLEEIVSSPDGPVAKDTTPTAAPPTASSSEREALEERITGPILKVYGRGRVDIPTIGDNELRFMVENPEGGALPQALEQARALDAGQPEEAASPPSTPEGGGVPLQQPAPLPPPAASVAEPSTRLPSDPTARAEAAEIIKREHFPVPPDIEEPPRLPNDVSKVSDDELRSLHARFHAVEARVNWVISDHKDEAGDLEKLIADREVTVRNETPKTQDSKRLTKEDIAAIVAADPEVVSLKQRLKDVQKIINKLRVISENAHRDCERLSRQWSMRFREESDVPGGGRK